MVVGRVTEVGGFCSFRRSRMLSCCLYFISKIKICFLRNIRDFLQRLPNFHDSVHERLIADYYV